MNVWIIGGGLAGIASSWALREEGVVSHIFEARQDWGGLVRSTVYGGEGDAVIHEPHGSHIFHTDDAEVWKLVTSLCPFNSYEHRVQTMVRDRLMTWPIQEQEIRDLYGDEAVLRWDEMVSKGLLVEDAATQNFEDWCLSIMPPEVYDDFVASYTEKQWGRHPSQLSASFAPKRVQVRRDGDDRLFKDRFQGYPDAERGGSYESLLREMLGNTPVHVRHPVSLTILREMLGQHPPSWRPDVVIVTTPLDKFCHSSMGRLEWRGLTFSHRYLEPSDGFAQTRMVVNWPDKGVPWIRTHETKHASGQQCRGTVLTTEFPGGPGEYYPVPGADGVNRKLNSQYRELIRERLADLGPTVLFVGRLANYVYYDMDDCIREALDTVRALMHDDEAAA